MTTHRSTSIASRSARTFIQHFDARPASWMISFLRLASRSVSHPNTARPRPPWVRLGGPERLDGGAAYPFVWWPHLGPELFDSFHGSIRVAALDKGSCSILLEGVTSGGLEPVNARVLKEVLDLIVAAASADQPFSE